MFQVDMFKGQAFSQIWTILWTQTQSNVRERYQSPIDIAVNFHFREILVQDHFSSSKKLERFERENRKSLSEPAAFKLKKSLLYHELYAYTAIYWYGLSMAKLFRFSAIL